MSSIAHPQPASGLTISAVAARTGLGVPVLRAWESRYGFPRPERLPGGHRRYSEADIDRIRRVDAARATGLSVEAAIDRVRRESATPDPSVFAGLRRRHPDLLTARLRVAGALAISRAIEDEHLARGEAAMLVGAFQEERFYRASEARWRELARTAAATAVLAELPTTRRRGRTWEVGLTDEQPLRREWLVVCDGPAPACFAAWEVPGSGPGRRFEATWSTDPIVVRSAAELAIQVVATVSAAAADDLRGSLGEVAVQSPPGFADRITQRAVTWLDRRLPSG